jgi:hypothetical protein
MWFETAIYNGFEPQKSFIYGFVVPKIYFKERTNPTRSYSKLGGLAGHLPAPA